MTTTSPFWPSIDAVVVVNLDHRADRWAQMQAHLAQIAPMEKVHRLSAVRGVDVPDYGDPRWFGRTKRPTTWAGRAGCTLSHRNALRLMKEKGWRRMLILEDDARFVKPADEAQGVALAEFWATAKPGVSFLGFTEPRGPVARLRNLDANAGLYRIGGCLTTHAYTVDARACDILLRQFPADDRAIWPWLARNNAIDAWYARHLAEHCEVTAVSPVWVEQAESVSDITHRAGGTAQGNADMNQVKNGACARLREDVGMWFKWRLRQVRGF